MTEDPKTWGEVDSRSLVIDRVTHFVYKVTIEGAKVVLTDRTTLQKTTFQASDEIDLNRFAVGRP